MVALPSLAMVVVVALKVAVVAAAGTVTDAGTVRVPFVFVSVTVTAAGAALVRATVHVLEAFGPRVVGLQVSEETSTGATRLTVVFAEVPPAVAVRVAL